MFYVDNELRESYKDRFPFVEALKRVSLEGSFEGMGIQEREERARRIDIKLQHYSPILHFEAGDKEGFVL